MEKTIEDYFAQGRRCADRKNAIQGVEQLRTLAADCQTKTDYVRFFRETLHLNAVDEADGIVLHLGKTQCTCPLYPKVQSPMQCYCTQGHEQYVWSAFFGKQVEVEIIESFQRGGNDCVIKIKV